MSAELDHTWGIILAGGDGKRLQEFTRVLFGVSQPKQFCAFTGTRSMFRHTFDRINSLIPSERILSLIRREHIKYAANQLNGVPSRNVILLPTNKETAPSILYSLIRIARNDPDGVVALLPADHFVLEEDKFVEQLRDAFDFRYRYWDDLVILGVEADYPETGYGWIEPDLPVIWKEEESFTRVRRFWQKPSTQFAENLLAKGCLWNTTITLGTVHTLLQLFSEHLPRLYMTFNKVAGTIGSARERKAVETIFEQIESVNFFSGLMEQIPYRLRVMHVRGVHWSNWGEQSRITRTMESFRYDHNARLSNKCPVGTDTEQRVAIREGDERAGDGRRN